MTPDDIKRIGLQYRQDRIQDGKLVQGSDAWLHLIAFESYLCVSEWIDLPAGGTPTSSEEVRYGANAY